ncbi:unnamed protein product, partial [Nesidiocoris tenuis]
MSNHQSNLDVEQVQMPPGRTRKSGPAGADGPRNLENERLPFTLTRVRQGL